ncbi:hypothetical protein Q7P37_006468 [Cladosporium fusiforme]
MAILPWLFCLVALTQAQLLTPSQQSLIQPQNNTFNSSFTLTPAQIAAANLSSATAHNFETAVRIERSNNAGSLPQEDPFYQLPSNTTLDTLPPPGTILKVEQHTNTTLYTLPPTLSLSRFLYVSESVNNTRVPASAYVLWPFTPRRHRNNTIPKTYPTIGFAHGTSGQTPACAPSNLRNLWDDFHGPFAAALAGYAVVATDYVGLGISNTTSPYFILPSQANDVFHAVAAAQNFWSNQLSKNFVLMGQSQGGGTTWAAAQRQAEKPVEGYLGALAASPFTDVLADIAGENQQQVNTRVAAIAQGLSTVRESFSLDEWLTDVGIARTKLMLEASSCGPASSQLFDPAEGLEFLRADWNETESAKAWEKLIANGEKEFAGPMLVLQGDEDGNAIEEVTTRSVKKTCEMLPKSKLSYSMYKGVTHAPIMFAAHHQWLQWIEDRFEGVGVEEGCHMEVVEAGRGEMNTVKEQQWEIEFAL